VASPDWILCLGESAILWIVGTIHLLFFFATYFSGGGSPSGFSA
jgi:hypothetical protein